MKFGDRIKQRRIELHMSAGELASLIGKNRATIYRYENGDIENISLDMLDPLAEALSVKPEYLMGWCNNCDNKDSFKVFDGIKTFEIDSFTEEEYAKLVEYAKFLVYLREK